jgi:Flp pilus assembly protein TadG
MARNERASVLLLVPAGIVVFIVLASIAVDLSHLWLERRELTAAASAAANDAAALGIDPASLRDETTDVRLDPGRVQSVATTSLAAQGIDAVPTVSIGVGPGGEPQVTVTLTGRVDYIFAPAVPGGPSGASVTVSASALVVDE